MAASFYVYQDIEQYSKHYPTNTPIEQETPIESWHIFPKKGVWVVVNLEHRLGRGSVLQSLNIILDGKTGLDKLRVPSLIDINLDNIRYFYKNDVITFHSPEATYTYKCSRYVGDKLTKGKIKDWISPSMGIETAFYDAGRNRICLILTAPSSLVTKTEALASPSHASSAF